MKTSSSSCHLAVSMLVYWLLLMVAPRMASAWSVSRRSFMAAGSAAVVTSAGLSPAALAISSSSPLIEELKECKLKLEPIAGLLEEKEWDKVRSILKLPPVNKLWNLGDSQNIILKIAKDTGNVDLFELKEDVALNLQMCDQLTYDNAFVYFQPGNGKFNIKEPQELARRSMGLIQQAIDMAIES